MNYRDTLHAIDTAKALELLGIQSENKGAYLTFPCPNGCESPALFKTYGDRKNLWYCPKCKKGGNLIKLTMEKKNLEWQPAKELLSKAITQSAKPIAEEMTLSYELEYPKFLEDQGIPEALCKEYGVGQPKGRTMLAGCVTFTVHDETGKKVAYYGFQMKDRKPKFHTSFNPELYLYNLHRIDRDRDVLFTTDLMLCLKSIVEGKQAVSTFTLPYLSQKQLDLIGKLSMITVFREDEEIVRQVSRHFGGYVRFAG